MVRNKNSEGGYVVLVVILIVVAVVAYLYWRTNFSIMTTVTKEEGIEDDDTSRAPTGDSYIIQELNAVNRARDAKNLLEEKSRQYDTTVE